MRTLFESWRTLEASPLCNRAVRERARGNADRIASALLAAELAGQSYQQTGNILALYGVRMNPIKRAATEQQLKMEASAHLRDCAYAAAEMQRGIADALGSWVLSECSVGTGLSRGEMRTLIEVSGGATW